jgi:hypothetical protein
MVNPKYIEDLNTIGVDIDTNPQPLKPTEPSKKQTQPNLKYI